MIGSIYQTLVLAVIALGAPAFAKFAGYELKRKPFELVGCSGLFFLLAVAFGLLPLQQATVAAVWSVASIVCYFIAWFSLLIGALWQLFEVVSIPEAREHEFFASPQPVKK